MNSKKDCPIEVECEDVQKLIRSGKPLTLLDCREPNEFEIASIEGATLIPMSELGDRLDEIQALPSQTTIVFCHHGGRSLRVALWMRQQGVPQAQSMAGGIDVWAQSIDPEVPRY